MASLLELILKIIEYQNIKIRIVTTYKYVESRQIHNAVFE